jgi:hypothetical protein
VIYKTLVGHESVFPPAWDVPDLDLRGEVDYRKERIKELVAEVNDENAKDWLATLQRCAATESDDLATFPSLGEFLQKLSEAKPQIVLGFIDRLGGRLTGFLGVILSGLAKSDYRRLGCQDDGVARTPKAFGRNGALCPVRPEF